MHKYHSVPTKNVIFSERNESRKINYFPTSDGSVAVQEKNDSYSFSRLTFIHLKKILKEVFLPQFYPDSVSSDYMEYQIWDTIQAFCSTISGTLTTRAIFHGVGVGDTTATALSATITWIMKDGTGMIGRILFAWWKGYTLDTDCKKWRLAADIINDVAMCLELLLGSALYFKNHSSLILCCSTSLKAIVGVAGGATRASITQHQAIRNNMADVSAKDGSQETCVNLIASFVAVFILTRTEESPILIWTVFLLATSLHIFANYKAVKGLKLRTLNESRLVLLIQNYLRYDGVFRPDRINKEESVFFGFGTTDHTLCRRKIRLGSSLREVIPVSNFHADDMTKLRTIYGAFTYCIAYNDRFICVMLEESTPDQDVIMSYFHALILGIGLEHSSARFDQKSARPSLYNDEFIQLLRKAKEFKSFENLINEYVMQKWISFNENMKSKGWNIQQHQLSVGEWKMKWNS